MKKISSLFGTAVLAIASLITFSLGAKSLVNAKAKSIESCSDAAGANCGGDGGGL